MVDEENNIIQSKFLQNMKNLNIGQSNSVNQTTTDLPPFLDLNLDNNPFPAPNWVVPPDFCQDTNSQTFNNHTHVHQTPQPYENLEREVDNCQPLDENVGTYLLHSTPSNLNTESLSLSNQRDNHLEFKLSKQEETRTFPTLQSNSTNVFQKNMNTARLFETSTTDHLFQSLPTTSSHISKNMAKSNDIFNTFPSVTEEEASPPSPLVPPFKQSNIKKFDFLSDLPANTQKDVEFKYKNSNYDMPHTSPGDTKHDMVSQNGIRETSAVAVPSSSTSPNGNLVRFN